LALQIRDKQQSSSRYYWQKSATSTTEQQTFKTQRKKLASKSGVCLWSLLMYRKHGPTFSLGQASQVNAGHHWLQCRDVMQMQVQLFACQDDSRPLHLAGELRSMLAAQRYAA
jgi:hypothetical protein